MRVQCFYLSKEIPQPSFILAIATLLTSISMHFLSDIFDDDKDGLFDLSLLTSIISEATIFGPTAFLLRIVCGNEEHFLGFVGKMPWDWDCLIVWMHTKMNIYIMHMSKTQPRCINMIYWRFKKSLIVYFENGSVFDNRHCYDGKMKIPKITKYHFLWVVYCRPNVCVIKYLCGQAFELIYCLLCILHTLIKTSKGVVPWI